MARWKITCLALFSCIYRCCCVTSIFNETNLIANFLTKADEFLGENNTISEQCKDHLVEFTQGLRSAELWALKMFDSGAKFPSGVLQGNWFDLGAFDECLGIENKLTSKNTIFGKYCIGMMLIDRKLLQMNASQLFAASMLMQVMPEGKMGIQLATCMPDSCSAAEIQDFFSKVGPKMIFYDMLCQTQATQPQPNIGSIATIKFFYVISLIMIVSTVYEIMVYYTHKRPIHPLLTAFSILSNWKKLITTNYNPERFACLDGLRVLCLISIVYWHTALYRGFNPINNSVDVWNWFVKPSNIYAIAAVFAVETFFLISGLLISYNFMTMAIVKEIKFNIFIYYLRRYLRITPILAVVIAINLTLLIQMGSGPLWQASIQIDSVYGCAKYWWKALLYIQNIGGQDAWCVSQSWYVCLDMQLFLLSPIILLPLKRWPKQTLTAVVFLAVCSGIYCFVIGWIYNFKVNAINTMQRSTSTDYNRLYYKSIPGRAGTWLVGIILGCIIFQTKQRKTSLTMSKMLVLFLWTIAIVVAITCVWTTHEVVFGDYSRLVNSLQFALVRYVWAVAASWIIFACLFGFGGSVNWLLSLPMFQILSKLSFIMYLVHLQVIQFTTAQIRVPSTFNDASVVHGFLGDFAITLVVSVILMLAIESPMAAIEQLMFSQKKAVKDPKRTL